MNIFSVTFSSITRQPISHLTRKALTHPAIKTEPPPTEGEPRAFSYRQLTGRLTLLLRRVEPFKTLLTPCQHLYTAACRSVIVPARKFLPHAQRLLRRHLSPSVDLNRALQCLAAGSQFLWCLRCAFFCKTACNWRMGGHCLWLNYS